MPLFTVEADVLIVHDEGRPPANEVNGAELNAPIVAGYDILGAFKLLAHNGGWLAAKPGAPNAKEIRVVREPAADNSDVWIFYRYQEGDNEYALCNFVTHRFVSAEPWEWLSCNRGLADAWERFQLHRQGDQVALVCRRGPNGERWITVEEGGNVRTNRRIADTWEKFVLVPYHGKDIAK